jgi:hypothetical protein
MWLKDFDNGCKWACWAKSIDDGSSSTFGDTFANSVSSLPYFARDRRIAVSDFNVGRNLVFNFLLLLPDAPKSFGATGWVLDGWQYGGIFQVSSGLPITPLISGDPLGLRSADTFGFPNRDYTCNPVNKQSKAHYINTACFSYPTESSTYNPVPRERWTQLHHGTGATGLRHVLGQEQPSEESW